MSADPVIYVDDSPIHGRGLFAKTFLPSGSLIGVAQVCAAEEDGDHVLWVDEKTGFHVRCDLRFINHSDAPNAAYYDNLEVCTLRDIQPGEEITHDYAAGWRDL